MQGSPCRVVCKSHCHTVMIYATIAYELLKVKNRHYSLGQSCDNSTDGAFFKSSTTHLRCLLDNVCTITERVVAIQCTNLGD